MAKLAAIGPALAAMGISGTTLAGIAAMAAGTYMKNRSMKKHQQAQDSANQQWTNFQNTTQNRYEDREDKNITENQDALAANWDNGEGANRQEGIASDSARLNANYTAGIPDVVTGARGTGQEVAKSGAFDSAMATELSKATGEARERIQALSTAQAYGAGSQGGMLLNDATRNADSKNEIGFTNEKRLGDARVLDKYQSIQPQEIEYDESPWAGILSGVGQGLVGYGGAGGTIGGGKVYDAQGWSNSGWTGGGANAPATSTYPQMRKV